MYELFRFLEFNNLQLWLFFSEFFLGIHLLSVPIFNIPQKNCLPVSKICQSCFLNSLLALSHWCIFHRSKAELVVSTWSKQFHNSEIVQKVPLLYLANDIIQNSKRKGNEFVTEFWKVLPAAIKDLMEKGDDYGKNVVTRLVGPVLLQSR